jgi:hypothetical protein
MTKVALIFPPQWDPRQPPYSIPALAGALKNKRFKIKAWDLNLDLYLYLLRHGSSDKETKELLKLYLDPNTLKTPLEFSEISHSLEDILYYNYDSSGYHQLYWDYLDSGLSPNCSQDWQAATKVPSIFPFYKILKEKFKDILKWKPEIVGISAISDTQILPTLTTASIIRSKLPGVKIILGGHAFEARRELLEEVPWLFHTIDAVCIADGEPALISLAAGHEMKEIPNILWLDGNKVRKPVFYSASDLNSLGPPDFSLIPLGKYLSPMIVIPLKTSYGCPWNQCLFCNHPKAMYEKKNSYRTKLIDSVIHELKSQIQKGYKYFFFLDDAITVKRFRDICIAITKMDEKIRWLCYARLEEGYDIDTFRMSFKAGCRKIFFGLETASERLLKLYRKGINPMTAKRVIKDASHAGIAVHLFLMGAFPDETENDRKDTYKFLQEILPFVDPFGFTYDVFPLSCSIDTELFNNPTRFGAIEVSKENADDMKMRFSLKTSNEKGFDKFKNKIESIVEENFKYQSGLRHLDITQDSNHLLLLEAYEKV